MSGLYDEGEIVTYEDTPFAEYLASIESKEAVVRITDLPDRQAYLTDLMDMTSSWLVQKWSDFAEFTSLSLTPHHFARFDEELSRIVKSSYLLADTPLIHYYPLLKTSREKADTQPTRTVHGSIGVSIAAVVGTSLLAPKPRSWLKHLIHKEILKWNKLSRKSPWLWLWLASGSITGVGMTSIWLKRQTTKRALATQKDILDVLERLIFANQTLDIRIHKSMKMIQEIELVSRGYRLSTILPPISRIEQNSTTHRCLTFRRALNEIINDGINLYQAFTSLILRNTKSTVYELANSSNLASDPDELTLASIKRRFQLFHEVRRFALIEILKVENHLHTQEFISVWRPLVEELASLVSTTNQLIQRLTTAQNQEFKVEDVPMMEPTHINSKEAYTQNKGLLQGLAMLEQHIRAIQAKLYICSEDIRNSGEDLNRESLTKQYLAVKQDLNNLLHEWEYSYERLVKTFEPPTPAPESNPVHPLPQEPEMAPESIKVITWDAPSEDNEVTEKVFEAVSGSTEDDKAIGKKLTRAERIRLQKTRRQEEEQIKLKKREVSMMVDELRDVVKRRQHEKSLDTTKTQTNNN